MYKIVLVLFVDYSSMEGRFCKELKKAITEISNNFVWFCCLVLFFTME